MHIEGDPELFLDSMVKMVARQDLALTMPWDVSKYASNVTIMECQHINEKRGAATLSIIIMKEMPFVPVQMGN